MYENFHAKLLAIRAERSFHLLIFLNYISTFFSTLHVELFFIETKRWKIIRKRIFWLIISIFFKDNLHLIIFIIVMNFLFFFYLILI